MDNPQYLLAYTATILAAASVPFVHISVMRLIRAPGRALEMMLGAFLLSAFVWAGSFYLLKNGEPFQLSEWVAGYALLGFLWLGYMEMIFKIYRGFSHTLVTDVWRRKKLTLEEILSGFAEGMGMDEMFRRRIATMQQGGLIDVFGDDLSLTRKGLLIARWTGAFKSFLRLGKGG